MNRYLAALRAVAADRQALDEREHVAIDNARAAGATWLQIATALSKNSPQAAFQRFERIGKRIGTTRGKAHEAGCATAGRAL